MSGQPFVLTGALFLVGAALMYLGSRTATAAVRRSRWIKYGTYAAIIWGLLGAAWLEVRWPLVVLTGLISAIGMFELVRALINAGARSVWPAVPVYVAGAASLMRVSLGWSPGPNVLFIWLLIQTAVFDAFSQLVGQGWGRRKLAPRLSPGKTAGGLFGGMGAVVVVNAIFLSSLPMTHMDPGISLNVTKMLVSLSMATWISLPLCGAALAGDLGASWVKRRCGIKDFGTLLPGHGGVLDRFDSLLGTATLLAAWQSLR